MTTMSLSTELDVRALFQLAGFTVTRVWQLENQYWPRVEEYRRERDAMPWWLLKTEIGLIEIGRRKRVINIDWSETPVQQLITTDDVTMGVTMVHAWSIEKALEYLKALREAARKGAT